MNNLHNLFPDFMQIARPHMHRFLSCSADVSDYITVDDVSYENPIVVGVSAKFRGSDTGLVSYKLFRSYSTECAIFAATGNNNFLFVRDGYSTTTSTQLAKFEKALVDEHSALLRVNLYQASYSVRAHGYNSNTYIYSPRFHRSMDSVLSVIFSNVPQEAISSQSNEMTLIIKRSKFPLVAANNYSALLASPMRRAISPIVRLLYGVAVDRYFEV